MTGSNGLKNTYNDNFSIVKIEIIKFCNFIIAIKLFYSFLYYLTNMLNNNIIYKNRKKYILQKWQILIT